MTQKQKKLAIKKVRKDLLERENEEDLYKNAVWLKLLDIEKKLDKLIRELKLLEIERKIDTLVEELK